MTAATRARVADLLRSFMDSWIAKQYEELRRIEEEGISPSGILAPFHDALVPGIRGLGERGFSTALGNLHERIGLEIALEAHAEPRTAGSLPMATARDEGGARSRRRLSRRLPCLVVTEAARVR